MNMFTLQTNFILKKGSSYCESCVLAHLSRTECLTHPTLNCTLPVINSSRDTVIFYKTSLRESLKGHSFISTFFFTNVCFFLYMTAFTQYFSKGDIKYSVILQFRCKQLILNICLIIILSSNSFVNYPHSETRSLNAYVNGTGSPFPESTNSESL